MHLEDANSQKPAISNSTTELKKFYINEPKLINDKRIKDNQLKKVNIKVFEFGWFFKDKNGEKFIEILARAENIEVFVT